VQQLIWLDRLEAEYDNITALNWAQESGAIAGLHLATVDMVLDLARLHRTCLALENLLTLLYLIKFRCLQVTMSGFWNGFWE
jgi:hypothetical protein